MKTIFITLALSCGVSLAGTPEAARKIARDFDQAHTQWIQNVRTAPDNTAQNAAWLRRPDAAEAGSQVWEQIRADLKETWILEPAAWLLTNSSEFAVTATAALRGQSPATIMRDVIWEHHLNSPKIGPYCIALTEVQDPKAMRLLETIEKTNPSEAVKGAAALAQAILHRRLGGGKFGMAIRQEKLRTAIKSPDLTVGKTTTMALLKDELFRMSRLNLDTVAPDFRGIEVTQKISTLSSYKGKVVVLFFWHALMPSHDESLALFRKYQEEFAGKDIVILGVNLDNPLTLRKNIAQKNVTWTNFSDSTQTISKLYRIETWPSVFVLDEDQKIRYVGAPGAFVKITAEDLAKQIGADKAAKEAAELEEEAGSGE
jgi:peroxiredoxin